MKRFTSLSGVFLLAGLGIFGVSGMVGTSVAAEPYKIVKKSEVMGSGGTDYVYADNDGRKLYVPRGGEILVFDLDTLRPANPIPNARARGVAVDPKSHHGFCSSSPVVMWDSTTLKTIKTIDVE